MEDGSNTPRPPGRIPDVDVGEVRSTTETRQGVTGQNVRYVLIIGTVAVIAILIVVYAVIA